MAVEWLQRNIGEQIMASASAKRRIWGWWCFDWASQPYSTLLLTFIFGPYFAQVARDHYTTQGMDTAAAGAAAQSLWGAGLAICSFAVALLAPFLGALADAAGRRLVWIWAFSGLYVLGACGLWALMPTGDGLLLALGFFGLGFIGMEFATIFTNALLPALGPRDEIGAISGSGFAFGYLGGVLALALMLLFFAENAQTGRTLIGLSPAFGLDATLREGTRAVGPFTALWYAVFMVPFFLWVQEPKTPRQTGALRAALSRLWALITGLRRRPSLAQFLVASLVYRDALNALYGFGGIYAVGVLGWSVVEVGSFGVIGALAAAAASWMGGRADRRFGPKPVIITAIVVLIAVCIIILGLDRRGLFTLSWPAGSALPDQIFYLCGALIGGAGGALQSASRTMMVRHTSLASATEAFGLYALSGRVTSFLAPALITAATMASGSQRWGMVPLVVLFLGGLALMARVSPEGETAP